MSVINVDKNTFQTEVMNASTPVLIDFWAPWCGPCRMVSPIIDEIAASETDKKVCKVNVDENPELAGQFGVFSIPTLLVIKDGQVVNEAVGLRSKDEILNMLNV